MNHLKYSTEVIKNPTKKALIQTIDNSAVPKTSALFCIFMSHGGDNTLFIDGESISVQDIITAMDTPSLYGKPKVLILQACRGSGENRLDYHRCLTNGSFELSSPDMLVVYSSLKGTRAARNGMIPLLAKSLRNAEDYEDLCEIVRKTVTVMTITHPQQVPEMRSSLRYKLLPKMVGLVSWHSSLQQPFCSFKDM